MELLFNWMVMVLMMGAPCHPPECFLYAPNTIRTTISNTDYGNGRSRFVCFISLFSLPSYNWLVASSAALFQVQPRHEWVGQLFSQEPDWWVVCTEGMKKTYDLWHRHAFNDKYKVSGGHDAKRQKTKVYGNLFTPPPPVRLDFWAIV